MPEAIDNCVQSVLEENPEYSESRAYAICHAQQNKGELSVGENPSHEELLQALADAELDCPDGQVSIGENNCVDYEEVQAPPSVVNSKAVLAARGLDTEPIERSESGETVTYANLRLLTEGVWTDQKSKTPTLYSEEGIAEIEAQYSDEFNGPPVNVMHDVDPENGAVNDASHGGYVDPDSIRFENGALMGDVVLDTSKAAGAFADENLQSALESNGRVGFGGPSVELDLDPQAHIENSDHPQAEKEINGGYLTGLGLVMNPADKNIDFAKETRQRAVAMSGQTDKAVYLQESDMSDLEAVRTALEQNGFETEDKTDEELKALQSALLEEDEEEEDEEMADDETPMEEEAEEGEAEEEEEMADDEEEEEDESEMADAVDVLEEQIDDLWGEIEDLKEGMMGEEEMQEALSGVREELAEADTVEEIDKRLSQLEEEPEEPRSLADQSDEDVWFDAEGRVESDTTF